MGRKSKTTDINSFDVNSNSITDPETITEELNLHFSTIAEKPKLKQRQTVIKVPKVLSKELTHGPFPVTVDTESLMLPGLILSFLAKPRTSLFSQCTICFRWKTFISA